MIEPLGWVHGGLNGSAAGDEIAADGNIYDSDRLTW
jgi:hypothetical protein